MRTVRIKDHQSLDNLPGTCVVILDNNLIRRVKPYGWMRARTLDGNILEVINSWTHKIIIIEDVDLY